LHAFEKEGFHTLFRIFKVSIMRIHVLQLHRVDEHLLHERPEDLRRGVVMVARGVRVAVRGVLFVAGEVVADEEANSEDDANCRYVQHPPSGAKEVEGFRELHR
jgi:hypothetical protein